MSDFIYIFLAFSRVMFSTSMKLNFNPSRFNLSIASTIYFVPFTDLSVGACTIVVSLFFLFLFVSNDFQESGLMFVYGRNFALAGSRLSKSGFKEYKISACFSNCATIHLL